MIFSRIFVLLSLAATLASAVPNPKPTAVPTGVSIFSSRLSSDLKLGFESLKLLLTSSLFAISHPTSEPDPKKISCRQTRQWRWRQWQRFLRLFRFRWSLWSLQCSFQHELRELLSCSGFLDRESSWQIARRQKSTFTQLAAAFSLHFSWSYDFQEDPEISSLLEYYTKDGFKSSLISAVGSSSASEYLAQASQSVSEYRNDNDDDDNSTSRSSNRNSGNSVLPHLVGTTLFVGIAAGLFL